jgi:hypothetical protein
MLHCPVVYASVSKGDVLKARMLSDCTAPPFKHFRITPDVIAI